MTQKKQKLNLNNKGFTIIETMISVSLFIVVTTIGMGSLLNANLVYQKSRDMRSIIDSTSHAMEDISRHARTGYNYHCFDYTLNTLPAGGDSSYGTPLSCAKGWAVAFEDAYGNNTLISDQWVYSIQEDIPGQGGKLFKSTNGGSTQVQMTPDELKLDLNASSFTVFGAESPTNGDQNQPIMTIRLVGDIMYKGVSTPFALQTSVSQRLLDF